MSAARVVDLAAVDDRLSRMEADLERLRYRPPVTVWTIAWGVFWGYVLMAVVSAVVGLAAMLFMGAALARALEDQARANRAQGLPAAVDRSAPAGEAGGAR